ncbi:MAG TPA: hypothetical protein VGH90_14090, partial [Chthoniobacteraceae bacterium]
GSNTDDHTYIWCNDVQNSGWTFTAPATTSSHTLNVLFGGATSPADAVVQISGHLSDSSAPDFSQTVTITTNTLSVGTFTYNAASTGQTLTIKLIKVNDAGQASVDLDAAWLQ